MGDLLLRGKVVPAVFGNAAKSSAEIRREVLGAELGRHPFCGPWHNNHSILLAEKAPLKGNFSTFQKNGDLQGVPGAQILFLQEKKLQDRAVTDSNGEFVMSVKDEGVYSVLATDGRAFGCYAVKVARHHSPQAGSEPLPVRPVSFLKVDQQGDDLSSSTATPEDTDGFLQDQPNATGTPTIPTTANAPLGGGGAGGGGGGALGAAALAGLGAATGLLIAELTASEN
jgi:hypothetical protein